MAVRKIEICLLLIQNPTDFDFQILSLYLSHPLLDFFLCQIFFSLKEILLLSSAPVQSDESADQSGLEGQEVE